jgi:Mrp family chromosome partitioning ATPase
MSDGGGQGKDASHSDDGGVPADNRNRSARVGPDDAETPVDTKAPSEIVSLKPALADYDPVPWERRAGGRRAGLFGTPADAAIPRGMATSEQIEPFRELRTRLMLMATSKGLAHFTTIVVPLTEDSGGSFVARNLAAVFTLQKRHALLIDCNFKNATQHEALRSDTEIEGLFEFLGRAGQEPTGLPMWPTAIPGLHLIPAGRCETTFAGAHLEYLASNTMKQLMATLRAWPCYVVLDAPPVKGSPDARLLSDLADFVVLVVGHGRCTNHEIKQAAAVFDREKLAGVAFNEYAGVSSSKRPR